MPSDAELSRLAEEALLKEAKRGAQRAETCGPSGWLKNRLPSTNKTFLHNTILGALAANKAKERQERTQSERGKRKRELEEKERNTYKRVYLHASTKPKSSQANASTKSSQSEEVSKPAKRIAKSDKKMIWSENGLEISTSGSAEKSKKKSHKISDKKNRSDLKEISKVLSRNIKFVSSTKEKDTNT